MQQQNGFAPAPDRNHESVRNELRRHAHTLTRRFTVSSLNPTASGPYPASGSIMTPKLGVRGTAAADNPSAIFCLDLATTISIVQRCVRNARTSFKVPAVGECAEPVRA
jgi:hypothetical protein